MDQHQMKIYAFNPRKIWRIVICNQFLCHHAPGNAALFYIPDVLPKAIHLPDDAVILHRGSKGYTDAYELLAHSSLFPEHDQEVEQEGNYRLACFPEAVVGRDRLIVFPKEKIAKNEEFDRYTYTPPPIYRGELPGVDKASTVIGPPVAVDDHHHHVRLFHQILLEEHSDLLYDPNIQSESPKTARCTCGASAVKDAGHASYCDLAQK